MFHKLNQNTLKDKSSRIVPASLIYDCRIIHEKNETGDAFENKNKKQKKVYLTFDDGPSGKTNLVLDVLKKEGVKATFFLISDSITEDQENIVKRMVEEGHEVGVHTKTHDDDLYKSLEHFTCDCLMAKKRIEEVTGKKVCLQRFPWGSSNYRLKAFKKEAREFIEKEGMRSFDWNVSGEDSVGKPTYESVYNNVMNGMKIATNPVILLHDSESTEKTIVVLPGIIRELKKEGYEFEVLSKRENETMWK